MDTVKINVTQDLIDMSVRNSCDKCALALALNRHYEAGWQNPVKYAYVKNSFSLLIKEYKRTIYHEPKGDGFDAKAYTHMPAEYEEFKHARCLNEWISFYDHSKKSVKPIVVIIENGVARIDRKEFNRNK